MVFLRKVPLEIFMKLRHIADEENALGVQSSFVKIQAFLVEKDVVNIFTDEDIYLRYISVLEKYFSIEDCSEGNTIPVEGYDGIVLTDVPLSTIMALSKFADAENALYNSNFSVKIIGGGRIKDIFDIEVSENLYEKHNDILCKYNSRNINIESKKFVRTLAFDFDGVIHSYTSKYVSADIIPDSPVAGIKEAIEELRKKFKIVIFSSRASSIEGKNAIIKYLTENNIYFDDVTSDKPAAFLYIDDRAIRFNGDVNKLLEEIYSFKKPWNK